MANLGNQQFTYKVFKASYDADEKIKNIVDDFNKDGLSLKTSEIDDLPATRPTKQSKVKQMAKRAVDL